MSNTEQIHAFTKPAQRNGQPSGLPANSPAYHQRFSTNMMDVQSGKLLWPYDPYDSPNKMEPLIEGLVALCGPKKDEPAKSLSMKALQSSGSGVKGTNSHYDYPCPSCGAEGSDATHPLSVNTKTGIYYCRQCGLWGQLQEKRRGSELSDPTKAVQCFAQYVKCHPEEPARAFVNMNVAFIAMGDLEGATKVNSKIRQETAQGRWKMTPEALSMVHVNCARVHFLSGEKATGEERHTCMEAAASEYRTADELNGHINSSRLFPWLVVLLELGRKEEVHEVVQRINDYVSLYGESARAILTDYQARHPQLREFILTNQEVA